MQVGRLDHRIRFEQATITPDADYGSPVATWAEFRTCWANIEGVLPTKAEAQAGQIVVASRPLRITFRWCRGITPDMRIRVPWGAIPFGDPHIWTDTLIYQIVSGPAEPVGSRRGQWLQVMAQEYSTSGEAI